MLSEVAGTCISLNFMCHALHDLRPECAGSSGYEKSLSVGSWPNPVLPVEFVNGCYRDIAEKMPAKTDAIMTAKIPAFAAGLTSTTRFVQHQVS